MSDSIRNRVARLETQLAIGRATDWLGEPALQLTWEPGETPPEPPEGATAAQLRVYNVLMAMDDSVPDPADAGAC